MLILAPLGRDASLAAETLAQVPLMSYICRDLGELRREIARGAGTVVVTDEALDEFDGPAPDGWVGAEPTWSQLPLVVLTGSSARTRTRTRALRQLERRRNLNVLQRPVPRTTLVSTVLAALESRRRQYLVRDLLERLETAVHQRDLFLATLGHELRNPLAAIVNGMQLLRESGELGGNARPAVDMVGRQVSHLSRLLDDLLDVSRVTQGKLELKPTSVDPARSIRSVADALRFELEQRKQTLTLELPELPVRVDADETRLEQILWNLLSNASRYTPAGGQVHVSLATDEESIVVRVADDGQGMTSEFLEQAFEHFTQAGTRSEGLGIGLPLARRLAELHGGSLTAESEGLGRGSVFTLSLPRRTQHEATEPPPPSRPAARRRVLLVEDNEDLAWSLVRLLETLGHEVRRVDTGSHALALATDYRPDVVLLDIGLPDMSGTEVAVKLRETLGAAPVVAAMTGHGHAAARKRSLAAGCNRHMTKPVTLDELQSLLGESKSSGLPAAAPPKTGTAEST